MGDLNVMAVTKSTDLRGYSKQLFNDVEALERMIAEGMIESGIQRIGVEQELCLIDKHAAPIGKVEEVLSLLNDPHFTTELAKFNMEINLDPLVLSGDCFTRMEQELLRLLGKCETACKELDCRHLLTGILPTVRREDLVMETMTQRQRYHALNQAILEMRKSPQVFHIQGTDELTTKSESVMFESCNTSFQVHFQIEAADFLAGYNWSQTIAGPVLAACTNAPLFLGKRLWQETRIALFQQATDTRGYLEELRKTKPRVLFGEAWETNEITDFIKKDISTYRPLVIATGIPDSLDELSKGQVPKLKAFALFNGTIYRWNRPCFGITNGKPHLRIENRYLPSGPSALDEVANAVFWIGLMNGMKSEHRLVHQHMEFHQVRTNFVKAARHGLAASFDWMGKEYDAKDLILNELIPLAAEGLRKAKINADDSDKYLGIIRERVKTGKTGSAWVLNSYNRLIKSHTEDTVLSGLTEIMKNRQHNNQPIHLWQPAKQDEIIDGPHRYQRVDQIMSKELYTVFEEDLIDLVPNIMKWNQVRHMLVENRDGELVGLVTLGKLGKYYAENAGQNPKMVKEVMVRKVITVNPDTRTHDAIDLMRKHQIGCLPVLNKKHKLVGVVTEKDLLQVAFSYLKK